MQASATGCPKSTKWVAFPRFGRLWGVIFEWDIGPPNNSYVGDLERTPTVPSLFTPSQFLRHLYSLNVHRRYDMPLDQVPMIATHNSFNTEEEGVSTSWEVRKNNKAENLKCALDVVLCAYPSVFQYSVQYPWNTHVFQGVIITL